MNTNLHARFINLLIFCPFLKFNKTPNFSKLYYYFRTIVLNGFRFRD